MTRSLLVIGFLLTLCHAPDRPSKRRGGEEDFVLLLDDDEIVGLVLVAPATVEIALGVTRTVGVDGIRARECLMEGHPADDECANAIRDSAVVGYEATDGGYRNLNRAGGCRSRCGCREAVEREGVRSVDVLDAEIRSGVDGPGHECQEHECE